MRPRGFPRPVIAVETKEDSDYKLGQDNVQLFGLDLHNPVFFISGLVIVAVVLIVLAFQNEAAGILGDLRKWLTSTLDWVFMIAANIFVLFCLFLIVSPYGKIRLGGPDAKPDYSYLGWFAMLFAARPWASTARTSRPPNRSRWQPRSSIGVSTPGRSMRWSRWRSPSSPITEACR